MPTQRHRRMARQVLQRAEGDGMDADDFFIEEVAEIVEPDRGLDHNYRRFLSMVVDNAED